MYTYSSQMTTNKKPPSLINTGANCYLNSALQGLSSCDKFVEDIKALHDSIKDLEKLSSFNTLILILNVNDGNRMELSRNEIFRKWNKPGQQDSFELLSYVMNQVYKEMRKRNEKYKNSLTEWLHVPLPLRLIVKNRIWCGCHTELDTPLQSNFALHIPLSSQVLEWQQLIDKFFDKEPIEGYSCDKPTCNGKGAKRSTILCKPLPRTLCIHLQRTYWNGFYMAKKTDKVAFTKTIIIKSKFCCDMFSSEKVEQLNSNNRCSSKLTSEQSFNTGAENPPRGIEQNSISLKETNPSIPMETDTSIEPMEHESIEQGILTPHHLSSEVSMEDETYQLTSVIVHSGSVYGGHYICYKRVGDQWFCTNDSYISPVKEKDVLKSEAYILFYEKAEKSDYSEKLKSFFF